MKNNRNVKSNQAYFNNGKWNTVYSDDDIKRLAYYNIDLPHVVGIGTQTPFSKISFGDSLGSGYHPSSLGNIESSTGLTPGKLSSIALHEKTRTEEGQPQRKGQEFNGIGYVTNLMNVRKIDKNNTEANGVGIFSNKFSATEDTSQKTDKAIMYITDSQHVQIGGVPTGYNLIDRNLQLLGSSNPSFNANTQETGPNIILDVSGSMHVNGFINFLKYGNNSSGPPAQNQDNPANQLTFNKSEGVIEYASDASKNSIYNRAAPEGAIFVGWDKEAGTSTLIPKPRLYIMVNGVQKRIATEEDTAFFDEADEGSSGFPITGFNGDFGPERFYIFRNNSEKPGTTMINTFSNITGDFNTASGSTSKPPPAFDIKTTGQGQQVYTEVAQSLQVIGNLSVFDFSSGGTQGTKLDITTFGTTKKVLTSEIYQVNEDLVDGNGKHTGKELGSIYTDRHIMIGGFTSAGRTFEKFGSAIDISGGTVGKPVMRVITGTNKGSIKSSNPIDSIIIGNTDKDNFKNKNKECILVGQNDEYDNNENTLVMGTSNTVKNTKNSIIVGKELKVESFTSETDGVVALGVGAELEANDRFVFATKDGVNAKKALTIDKDGNVTISENLNVLGEHVHLEVQQVVAEDNEIELNAKDVAGTIKGATTLASTDTDAGGLCLFTTAGQNIMAKFSYDKTNDRWTTANSTVTAGVGHAVGSTAGSEEFIVKSNGDLHIGTGTDDKFVIDASTGDVDISGDVFVHGSLNASIASNGIFTTVNASDSITAGDVGNSKYRVTASSGDVDMSGNLVVNSKYRVTASSGDVDMSGNLVVKGNEGIELKHGDFIKNTSSGIFSIGKTGATTTTLRTVQGNLLLAGEEIAGLTGMVGPEITLKSSSPANEIGSIDLMVSDNASGTVFGTLNIDTRDTVAADSSRNLIKINGGYDKTKLQGNRKGVSFDISKNTAGTEEVTNVKISGNLDVDGIIDPNGLILNNHTLTTTEKQNMANNTLGIFNDGGSLKFITKNDDGTVNAEKTFVTNTSEINGQTIVDPDISGNNGLKTTLGNLKVTAETQILEIRGGGGDETKVGKIQLNCHLNTHGQIIASARHGLNATNTLTLPGGSQIGNEDAVLVSDIGTQILKNKTLETPDISGTHITNNGNQLTLPNSAGTLALTTDLATGSAGISGLNSYFSNLLNLTVGSSLSGGTLSGGVLGVGGYWTDIASSSDGTKMVATVYGGAIWYSDDSGANWTKLDNQDPNDGDGALVKNWIAICSSSDRTKLAAVVQNGRLYNSTNGPQNFFVNAGDFRNWRDITCNSEGTKFAAVVNNGSIYIYNNPTNNAFGNVEVEAEGTGGKKWFAIASSSDMSNLAAVVGGDPGDKGNIWKSTDGGTTWTEGNYGATGGIKDWRDITMSADGTKLAAVVYGGNIWYSTDSGANWAEDTSVGATKNWISITSSSDGTNLVATVFGGSIWTSRDSGASWTINDSNFSIEPFKAVTSSEDGKKIAAASNNGIYTFDRDFFIGVGTSEPGEKLEVNSGNLLLKGDTPRIKFVSNDGQQGFQMIANHSDSINNGFGIIADPTSNNQALSIKTNGNVGIGTDSPGTKLVIEHTFPTLPTSATTGSAFVPTNAGSVSESDAIECGITFKSDLYSRANANNAALQVWERDMRKVARIYWQPLLYSDVGSINPANGTAIAGNHGNLCFTADYDDSPDTPRMVITSVGKVGIGTSTPVCSLDVGVAGVVEGDSGLSYNQVSIRAVGDILSGGNQGLIVDSDERIKENITEVPDDLALQMLRDIDCNYYEYKDKKRRGTQKTIGFIAQQVKEHVPMAVSLIKSIIPNEMRHLGSTWDGLNMNSDLTDVSGVKYRFYVSNDPSGNDEVMKEIVGNQDNTFTFDKHYNNVFCYGKEVDDFHTLAKQKLFTVNFSATQEIDKIQQEEKTKLAAAEERISVLETENATLKAQLNSIEARLAALEA